MTKERYQELLSRYRNDARYHRLHTAVEVAIQKGFTLEDIEEAVAFIRMAKESATRGRPMMLGIPPKPTEQTAIGKCTICGGSLTDEPLAVDEERQAHSACIELEQEKGI